MSFNSKWCPQVAGLILDDFWEGCYHVDWPHTKRPDNNVTAQDVADIQAALQVSTAA